MLSLRVPNILKQNTNYNKKMEKLAEQYSEYDAEDILTNCFTVNKMSHIEEYIKKKLNFSQEYIETILERIEIVADGQLKTLIPSIRDLLSEINYDVITKCCTVDHNIGNGTFNDLPTEILKYNSMRYMAFCNECVVFRCKFKL